MKSKLSLAQRLELIQAYQNGEKVSNLCRKFGISRVLFYRLLKRYNLSNSQKAALLPKKAKVERFVRQLPPRVEQSILKTVACDPTKSVSQLHTVLSPTLKVSRHAIQNVLLRNNLNKRELRLQFATDHKGVIRQNPSGLSPRDRRIMFDMVKRGITVSEVCRKFGISRVIFYRLRKRYETAGGAFTALEDKERKIERFARQTPCEVEEKVKQVVISRPGFSSHKISKVLATEHQVQLGNHGVHNVLKRLDLNTINKRILFAQGSAASVPKVKVAPLYAPEMPMYRLRQLIAPFVTIPKLLLTKPKKGIWYLVFGILPLVIFAFWTRLLLTAPSGTSLIGFIFASIALTFGLLFFIYSLKYYLTILMVLRLAQSGAAAPDNSKFNPSSTESRRGREDQSSRLGKLLSKLFKSQNQSRVNPLLVNLEKVVLDKKPFVSIHVAVYNETKVIERLIQACTSQAWTTDNSQLTIDKKQQGQRSNVKGQMSNYELVIVDDSTDETLQLMLQQLTTDRRQLIKTEANEEQEIYISRPAANSNQPTVKLIHRFSREGFKGGALQKALEQTDPRAEYICVFDADFVPYPDTLEQFVKTFQVLNANDNANEKARMDANELMGNSRVAAVQGYQWHVLNKSENWITRGVRTEYAGSYVIERSGEEIYQGLKQIAGSVYAIRADILRQFGWGTSITEDFQLTLRLYEAGYKVAFTPYIQAPAEAVSTVRRLIRQRMRWAEGASFNVKVMLARMLFGKWEVRSENVDNEVGNETEHSNLSPQNPASHLQPLTSRQWIPSRLTLAEKLEFAYLAPYYLQAAFLVIGTLSWFLSEAVFQTRLPFWTAAFGWSLVFTNLLSLPLMNIIGLFLEESDERDYVGIISFVALSYIVVPFQAYAAIKGFSESREGPWFRTPKTGLITDVLERSGFAKFFGNIFGRPAGVPITADGSGLTPNLALARAYNHFGGNFRIKPRHIKWIGNLALGVIIAITALMSTFAPFIPTTASYAKQPSLKTVDEIQKEQTTNDPLRQRSEVSERLTTNASQQVADPKNPENKEEIVENAQIEEITTPRAIAKTTKGGKNLEFIFHQEPRVRVKLENQEIEFETKSVFGQRVNPQKAKIYKDKEVIYEEIIKDVDLKYSLTNELLVEEFIIKNQSAIKQFNNLTIEQSVKTVDVKVVWMDNQTFGFYSEKEQGKELFKLSSPFAKDARGEITDNLQLTLDKKLDAHRLVKTLGESAKTWLFDPLRVYPVSIDPSVIVSGGIVETEVQFGGLQRKLAYVSSNWYAFYTDGTDVFYKKSSNGTSWGNAVDIDSTDADNVNPSVWLEGTDIYVVWIDDGGNTIEVNKIDTASSDNLGTQCTSAAQGAASGLTDTYTVSITVADNGTVYFAFTDTSTGTAAAVFRLVFSGCTFTAITSGSGLTAGDRPILVTINNTLNMIFQDGQLSHSASDDPSGTDGSWPITNVTIASVTDNFYDVTTDGTSLWVLTVSGTTATNFYKINSPIYYDIDTAAGDDAYAIYCVTALDCKIVYSSDSNSLAFVDCNNADCSSNTTSTFGAPADPGPREDADLYCITSGDCKIVYFDDSNDALKFVDCNDTDCDTPDATTTIESDTGTNGSRAAIDCPAANDCKIFYYNNAAGDVSFVDCADASCSSPSPVDIDTDVGTSREPNVAIDCPSANDCKLLYADAGTDVGGTTDLTFVNCNAADCSAQDSGSPVDVDTDIDTAGDQEVRSLDIDCPPASANNCKLVYEDESDTNDLSFVDCDDANCSTFTITDIDTATGGKIEDAASIFCKTTNDCKIVYYDGGDEDLTFVDCDDETCPSPTIVDLDSVIGTLAQNSMYCPLANDCKIIHLDRQDADATFIDCNDAACYATSSLTAPYVPLAFDAPSSANSLGGVTSLTWPHTTSGTDRILIVGVSLNRNASSITGVTYNSVAMTNIGSAGFGTAYMSLWQLVAPATGEHNIVVSLSGFAEVIGGATSWTGVHQTTPLGTFASATGTSTSPSVNVTSATGEMVVDTLNARGTETATVDPSQTERWNLLTTGAEPVRGTGSNETGAATVTMSWTLGASEGWAIGGVSLKPAGTTNLTSVSLTYDSTNSRLYAHVIKDTSEQAYFRDTDKTTISWGTAYSYGFTAGDLGYISAPMTAAGSAQVGVVLRQGSNFEFATVPEKSLFLLGTLPFLPKVLGRLRKRKGKRE